MYFIETCAAKILNTHIKLYMVIKVDVAIKDSDIVLLQMLSSGFGTSKYD